MRSLAGHLAGDFTVIVYDRCDRGESRDHRLHGAFSPRSR